MQYAGHPSCSAAQHCSLLSVLIQLVVFYRELDKGQFLLEGKDTLQGWTGTSEGCAVGRDGKSFLTSVLYSPSPGGTVPAHLRSQQHHILLQAPAVPVSPPCLCVQEQQEVTLRSKDRFYLSRQAPNPCRSQHQGAHSWGQRLPLPTTVHSTFLLSWLPSPTPSH